jgi:hypothetical protein
VGSVIKLVAAPVEVLFTAHVKYGVSSCSVADCGAESTAFPFQDIGASVLCPGLAVVVVRHPGVMTYGRIISLSSCSSM